MLAVDLIRKYKEDRKHPSNKEVEEVEKVII